MEDFDISKIKVLNNSNCISSDIGKFDISKIKTLNNSNCISEDIGELRRLPYPNIQQCSSNLLVECATTDQLENIKDSLNKKIKDKLDKLEAGDNIEIKGNTISVVGVSYDDSEIKLNILDLLNNKQNNINDLDVIREGASLGSTALLQFIESDPTVPNWAKEAQKPIYTALEVGALPDDTFIPTKTSDLNNDTGFITEETDPTVPDWAKLPNKPTYTASEVDALPSNTFIPTKMSDLTNDSGYIVSKDIPAIDKTSDYSSSFYIDPNKMYMFGTRTNLNIFLNSGTSGIVNEYMFQFTSGSTATTLVVPNTVVWLKNPDIQPNKKYAVSIENNLGIIGEWNNE